MLKLDRKSGTRKLSLLIFRLFPLIKIIKTLTTINMFTCLAGPDVTHRTAMLEILGSIRLLAVAKILIFYFFISLLLYFYFVGKTRF